MSNEAGLESEMNNTSRDSGNRGDDNQSYKSEKLGQTEEQTDIKNGSQKDSVDFNNNTTLSSTKAGLGQSKDFDSSIKKEVTGNDSEAETDEDHRSVVKIESSDSNETEDETQAHLKPENKPSKKNKKIEDSEIGPLTPDVLNIIYSEIPKRVRKPSVRLSSYEQNGPNQPAPKRQKTGSSTSANTSTSSTTNVPATGSKLKVSSVPIKSEPNTPRNSAPVPSSGTPSHTNTTTNTTKAKKQSGAASKKRQHNPAFKRESSVDSYNQNTPKNDEYSSKHFVPDAEIKNPSLRNEDNDDEYEDDDDDDDDDQQREYSGSSYCICRRPDTGQWMIGCDACDDWFHGECVNLTEKDSKRFVKYSCPRCTASGVGQSVYKRKCRLPGCNNPVNELFEDKPGNGNHHGDNKKRVTNKNKSYKPSKASKYCSKEHGILFFKQIVQQQLEKHKIINSAALSEQELAALVRSCNTIDQFRALGTNFPKVNLPDSKSTAESANATNTTTTETAPTKKSSCTVVELRDQTISISSIEHLFNASDRFQFKIYEARKASFLQQLDYFALRCELIQLCQKYTKKISEDAAKNAGVKKKDLCGYDSRLSEEKEEWKEGELESVIKQIEALLESEENENENEDEGENSEGGDKEENGEGEEHKAGNKENGDGVNGSLKNAHSHICMLEKRKCARHSMWASLFLEETKLKEQGIQSELEKVNSQLAQLVDNVTCRMFEPKS